MSSLMPAIRILLLEDSDDDVFFFQFALNQLKIRSQVVHFWDGGTAIKYLERCLPSTDAIRERPDIIFLDLKMPAMNGLGILEWMAQAHFNPVIPVVVLSGSENEKDIRRCRELGAADFIVKPIPSTVLKRCLSRLPHLGQTSPRPPVRPDMKKDEPITTWSAHPA